MTQTQTSVTMTLNIEDHYELYDTVIVNKDVTAPTPPTDRDSADFEEWVQDNIYVHTGVGHEDGDSSYFVEITDSSDPDLIGEEFEFGL